MTGKIRKPNNFLEQIPLIKQIVKEITHKILHAWEKNKMWTLKGT